MAKAEYQREVIVILTLSEAEFTWLKNMVQNPIPEIDSGEYNDVVEDEVSRTIRHSLWNAFSELQDFGYSDG